MTTLENDVILIYNKDFSEKVLGDKFIMSEILNKIQENYSYIITFLSSWDCIFCHKLNVIDLNKIPLTSECILCKKTSLLK